MGPAPFVPARHRVLVVDDVEVNRLIAIDLLNRLGIESTEAVNGLEALQAVQSRAFTLILMDIHMPIMDGLAATAAIRSLTIPTASIPIIAVTAGSPGDEARCMNGGMNDFLAKPITVDLFTRKITKWLRVMEDRNAS